MPCAKSGCGSADGPCPFINRNDSRCAARFTLGRLGEAFRLCVNDHHDCHVYDQIEREQDRLAASAQRNTNDAWLTPNRLNVAPMRILGSAGPSLS